MVSIRGAITVESNSSKSIINGAKELIQKIEEKNNINVDSVISMIFTCTQDLSKVAPAKAARELGYTNASLMCFNEMEVEDSLNMCIRLMVLCNLDISQDKINHIYLKGAKILRLDLQK